MVKKVSHLVIEPDTKQRSSATTHTFEQPLNLDKTSVKIIGCAYSQTNSTPRVWSSASSNHICDIQELTANSITLFWSGQQIDASLWFRAIIEIIEYI